MSPLTINSELGVDLNLHEGPEMVMVQKTVTSLLLQQSFSCSSIILETISRFFNIPCLS